MGYLLNLNSGHLLFVVLVITFAYTVYRFVKLWYEGKRMRYFFLRRHAQKKLWSCMAQSVGLLLATLGTGAYLVTQPITSIELPQPDLSIGNRPRQSMHVTKLFPTPTPSPIVQSFPTPLPPHLRPTPVGFPAQTVIDEPELPAFLNQISSQVEISDNLAIGDILFARTINDQYEAIDPDTQFATGDFTIYATFAYQGMEDGVAWAWVWRRNGMVLPDEGGNELWAYGEAGPGYAFMTPPAGFSPGNYSLEIWVNETLVQQNSFQIIPEGGVLLAQNSASLTVTPAVPRQGFDTEFGTIYSIPPATDRVATPVFTSDEPIIFSVAFSLEITPDYRPVQPGTLFGKGFYELYATFLFAGISPDTPWSWQWLHNNIPVEGGSAKWNFTDGGFVFYEPLHGWENGTYTLEIYVRNSLTKAASFTVQ